MRLLLAGLLALVVNTPVIAVDIKYIDSNVDGNDLYVDADSITLIKGGFEYNKLIVAEDDNKKIASRDQMLCSDKVSRVVAYEAYTLDGQLIAQRNIPNNKFHSIKLGSLESSLWEYLCE